MELREQLEIILITYNRKKFLEKTLKTILAADSPIKNLDITILENKSNDGTTELIEEYCQKYSNIKHIINKKNVGGNGNAQRAYAMAEKPYLWILCDDDYFDWTAFGEIEKAIEDGYDLIATQHLNTKSKNLYGKYMRYFSFLPGAICKTELITDNVVINMVYNASNLFPQLVIAAKCINENKKIYVPTKHIVTLGTENYLPRHLCRGADSEMHIYRANISWVVGFLNSTRLLKDDKIRYAVIDNLKTYNHPTFFSSILHELDKSKVNCECRLKNFCDMFCAMNLRQRFLFIAAFLLIELKYIFRKIKPEEFSTKKGWLNYLKSEKFDRKLKKLSKKYNDKKVLIYGAGLTFDSITEGFDLSKFNIAAISDLKFQEEQDYKGFRVVPPSKIKDIKPDVIFITLYRSYLCLDFIKSLNINYELLINNSCTFLEKNESVQS